MSESRESPFRLVCPLLGFAQRSLSLFCRSARAARPVGKASQLRYTNKAHVSRMATEAATAPDVSDAAATSSAPEEKKPPRAVAYKHSLAEHMRNVNGDGTFEERNDKDRPYEGGKEGAQNLPDIEVFAEAAGMKKKEDPDKGKPLEPLPEIPGMPMTVDQAYDFLGVAKEDRGNLDKVKMRFRKMSLKWHPDKNMSRQKEAGEVFTAVHAAYHFLTVSLQATHST